MEDIMIEKLNNVWDCLVNLGYTDNDKCLKDLDEVITQLMIERDGLKRKGN